MTDAPSDSWLSSEDLLRYARSKGCEVTERQLETLRSQRLIPHPERRAQAGLRPVWLSPPGTEKRLVRVLRLRGETTRDPDVLRVLLWLGGEHESPKKVRESLLRILDKTQAVIDRELTTTAKSRSLVGEPEEVRRAALLKLGRELANARSKNMLVRLASARGHRLPGIQALLYTFVLGEAPDASVGTGEDVERVLGVVPRATHDRVNSKTLGVHTASAGPWHDSAPLDLAKLAEVCSLPALRSATERCSDQDLLYAREAVGPLLHTLRWFADITGHLQPGNFLGLELFRSRTRRLDRIEYALAVGLVVSLLQSDLRGNLVGLVDAAQSFVTEFGKLGQFFLAPPHFVEEQMSKLTESGKRFADATRRAVLPPPSRRT